MGHFFKCRINVTQEVNRCIKRIWNVLQIFITSDFKVVISGARTRTCSMKNEFEYKNDKKKFIILGQSRADTLNTARYKHFILLLNLYLFGLEMCIVGDMKVKFV